jgi:tRNA 2-thiocytidine biosynthesis protein TtcA
MHAESVPAVSTDRKKAAERLEMRLLRQLMRASKRFRLLEPNDKVMVGISGGKDSWVMLHLLRLLKRRLPFPISLVAVNLDQGHPGFPAETIRSFLAKEGVEHRMLHANTYKVVTQKVPEGKTYCSLCSRLRRGILYSAAIDLGCTKIALGHHRDDAIETLLLNVFYAGQLKSMAPRLTSDDGRNVVIRPLIGCAEEEIAALAGLRAFPIVPCNLCGSQDNMHRQQVKALLTRLQDANPKVKGNAYAALGNVVPSHLLDMRLLHGEPTGTEDLV